MDKTPPLQILGVGTPILDHLLSVSPLYLDQLPGKKHGMETVDYEGMIHIIEKSGSIPKQIAGGSCVNALRGLASLGWPCAVTGKIGMDEVGEKVVERLQDIGITPFLSYSEIATAQVVCLVTPDGKRTCRSYLGAAKEMRPQDLQPAHFAQMKLVHIEGYTLLYPGVTERAMEFAKTAGALISFDMGSFEIVRESKEILLHLLPEYVDVLFANEDETRAFTGLDPKEGCAALGRFCHTAVVMIGNQGCWVSIEGTSPHHYPTLPIHAVDTTGAGDLFASGFLHGYLKKKPLSVCAYYGALTGSAVVQVVGAEIPTEKWDSIKQQMALL